MAAGAPTVILKEEHRRIERVVAVMVQLADGLETGRGVKVDALRGVVEFMRLVYEIHEKKEEIHLFPALQKKGVSVHSVPTRTLVEDHQKGRALVARLEEAASAYLEEAPSARESLIASLRGLAALYPLHIWQEDLLLFHQADMALTRADNEALLRGFNAVDDAAGGAGLRRFEQMAEEIERDAW